MQHHWQVIQAGNIQVSNEPEDLWKAAVDYFTWCEENPIVTKRTLTSGKEAGKVVEIESTRPYTIKGLCIHCGIDEEYILSLKAMKASDSMYAAVMQKILYVIHTQNVEYAVVGAFNPIFTAKILNIDNEEKPATNIKVEVIQSASSELATDESQVFQKMDLEKASLENRA